MFTESTEECYQSDASICRSNLRSCCSRGQKCSFVHDLPMEQYKIESGAPTRGDPCYFFMKGKCIDGETCRRSHIDLPCFNGTIKKMCRYFSQGRCERGKLCGYIHDQPHYHSSGDTCAVSQSNSFQLESNNVSPVIINPGDDIQSMVVKPKFCRFYKRGMCFFGDRCTNFHDKPAKDSDNFISNLRENEALRERKECEKCSPDKNVIKSNVSSVAFTESKESDANIPNVESWSSNRKHHHRMSRRVTSDSSKSGDVLPFSNNGSKTSKSRALIKSFTNVGESTEPLYTPLKSFDQINSSSSSKLTVQMKPCSSLNSTKETNQHCHSNLIQQKRSCSSSKPKEFPKVANNLLSNLKKFARVETYSPSGSKNFPKESKPYSKLKESVHDRHISSKSIELTKDAYSSKSIELNSGSCNTNSKEFFTSSCIALKPKGSSRSSYTCSYFQSNYVSNFSYNHSTSKDNFEAQCNSKLKELYSLRCTDKLISEELPANVYLESKKFSRNKLKEQSRIKSNSEPEYSSKHSKITEELRITEESLTNAFSDVTSSCNFNLRNFPMTKKQSKSQRKPKSENMQSRIFFKKMFFKTPVTVKHITKKLQDC